MRSLIGYPYQIAGTTQKISYTSTAAGSTGVGADTYALRICATSNAHYHISRAGTAAIAASDAYLPLGVIEYVGVKPGDIISFVQDSANGIAYITECTY